ncbi:hypothetical protein C0995_011219 [Termitomyces sp. Mi166|nr:hypothetical protein C0995_011219 [Termitomyces sp. Mi166\
MAFVPQLPALIGTLIQISQKHPGGNHTEYRGHGQPHSHLGSPGDIYINTDLQELKVYARLADSWTPWMGPLHRDVHIYHPLCNDLTLWCMMRTGPNWTNQSRRHFDVKYPEKAVLVRNKKNGYEDEFARARKKLYASINGDQTGSSSANSMDGLFFPVTRMSHTFTVLNIAVPEKYKVDANGMCTIPFCCLWGTSHPEPEDGNLGDFFFLVSYEAHKIFIKLDDWAERTGLQLSDPRIVDHLEIVGAVAWIDENQATWVSAAEFMTWARDKELQQNECSPDIMTADECVAELLPKASLQLPAEYFPEIEHHSMLLSWKIELEHLRRRNLWLLCTNVKILGELSEILQMKQIMDDVVTPESNTQLKTPRPLDTAIQDSTFATQTDSTLNDGGCSLIKAEKVLSLVHEINSEPSAPLIQEVVFLTHVGEDDGRILTAESLSENDHALDNSPQLDSPWSDGFWTTIPTTTNSKNICAITLPLVESTHQCIDYLMDTPTSINLPTNYPNDEASLNIDMGTSDESFSDVVVGVYTNAVLDWKILLLKESKGFSHEEDKTGGKRDLARVGFWSPTII